MSETNVLSNVAHKARLAVVTPFLDKQHGTERCIAEQVERLARDYEVHVYSSQIQDVDRSKIVWHRIPRLPGPHLLAYCWWFGANHLWRWWDRRFRGLRFDLTYTPGINCLDADVISVHILFFELYHQVKDGLSVRNNPVSSWGRLIHRRLYYKLIMRLERLVYRRQRTRLTAISRKTAEGLKHYGRWETPVIYYGVDPARFSPESRDGLRLQSRSQLGLSDSTFCLLFIGNDWNNKGLPTLLEAMARVGNPDLRLLVVGHDDSAPYRAALQRLGEGKERVSFLPPRSDVEFYYSAADAYVSPVLEDAFGLPSLEAMACGLGIIVSEHAGVSEVITDRVDGMILHDPRDVSALADLICELHSNCRLCRVLGKSGAKTASRYTWERNAVQLAELFAEAKRPSRSQGLQGSPVDREMPNIRAVPGE